MRVNLPLTLIILLLISATANAASSSDDYLEGHPSYNENYYTPSYNKSYSTPNYDSDYYNKTYNYNNNYTSDADISNATPQGNDIRDYNPYYDRDGNLKDFD